MPLGFEDLADAEGVAGALAELKAKKLELLQSGGEAQRRVLRRRQCDLRPRGCAPGRIQAIPDRPDIYTIASQMGLVRHRAQDDQPAMGSCIILRNFSVNRFIYLTACGFDCHC
jgi:hypothetical protein